MPDFMVTAPDGTQLKVTAPEGATHDQVVAYAQQNYTPKDTSAPVPTNASPDTGDILSTIYNHPGAVARQLVNTTPGQSTTIPYLATAGGGLMGAADEAGAGARGIGAAVDAAFKGEPMGKAYSNEYDTSLQNIRDTQKDFTEANPGAALTGKVAAGTILTAPLGALGAAGEGANLVKQGIAAAKVAAPVGAATGFMSGEGGFKNRTEDAAEDAATYAATAGVFPAGLSAVGNTLKMGGRAAAYIPKELYEMLQSHYAPETAALKQVGTVLGQDTANGVSPQQVMDAVQRTGLSPAEVGGPSMAAYGKDIANEPGASGPYLASNIQSRMDNQAEAIPQMIKDQLGSTGGGTNALDLAAQRKAAIAPLAEKAFGSSPDISSGSRLPEAVNDALDSTKRVQLGDTTLGEKQLAQQAIQGYKPTPEEYAVLPTKYKSWFQDPATPQVPPSVPVGADPIIQRLLANPDVQAGIPRGIRIIRNESDAAGTPFNIHDYGLEETNPGVENTSALAAPVPNMRLLDAAKRGLDAQISENSNEFGQLNDLGRTQVMLKNSLVGQMKNLSPAYKDYLENAADQFSLANAAKVGRGIWRTQNSEELISQMKNMSGPEKDMALNGAVRSLMDQIQKQPDSANHAITSLSKPYYRDLLRPLVGDDKAVDQLVSSLQEQATAYSRNKSMLSAAQSGMQNQFADKPRGLKDLLHDLQEKIFNSQAVRDRAGQIVMNQNPKETVPLLQQASRFIPKTPQNFVTNPKAIAPPRPPLNYQRFLQPFFQATNNQQGDQ